jgi:hypothetical protein
VSPLVCSIYDLQLSFKLNWINSIPYGWQHEDDPSPVLFYRFDEIMVGSKLKNMKGLPMIVALDLSNVPNFKNFYGLAIFNPIRIKDLSMLVDHLRASGVWEFSDTEFYYITAIGFCGTMFYIKMMQSGIRSITKYVGVFNTADLFERYDAPLDCFHCREKFNNSEGIMIDDDGIFLCPHNKIRFGFFGPESFQSGDTIILNDYNHDSNSEGFMYLKLMMISETICDPMIGLGDEGVSYFRNGDILKY